MCLASRWATRATALAICAAWSIAFADARHPHDGVFTAYTNGPPSVELSATDLVDLADGETLLRDIRVGDDDRSLAVTRVHAPPSIVWSVLLDFDRYPSWVEGLESSEIYEREGNDFYVSFKYRRWPVGEIEYHVHHTYPGEATGWGTWTLDYRRRSDLDDTVGFWRVLPVAGDPDSADVVYSTRVRLEGGIARLLGDWLLEDTLRAVTSGLKARAENVQTTARPR